MILNLVPVLFHLLFYQYLIFQLLILIRKALPHKAHSAEMADMHPSCRKCIYPRALVRRFGDLKALPLFLMKTLQSCKHQCAVSLLCSLVSWDSKAGSQQVKS